MSKFSGKCDLYDHISMLKYRTKEGSDKKEDLDKAQVYYSDELECFNIFKERTGGILHQHKVMTVTPYNYEEVTKLTEGKFIAIPHTRTTADKRSKTGERTEIYYTYKYWDKEYITLKELNKHKVYITIDIKFDTLLDLIPYYPYIVSVCYSIDNKEIVYISQESFVDSERDSHLEHGWYSDYWQHYKKELQKHYLEVCQQYFLYTLKDRECFITIKDYKPYDNDYYIIKTDYDIDYMHEPEFIWPDGVVKSHWTSPKFLKDNLILISKQDIDYYLKENIKKQTILIRYIKKCEFPWNLD